MKFIFALLICAIPLTTFAAKLTLHKDSAGYALDLYREIGSSYKDNIFFSPESAQEALAMTSLGSKGETLTGMFKALQINKETYKNFREERKAMVVKENIVSIVNKI